MSPYRVPSPIDIYVEPPPRTRRIGLPPPWVSVVISIVTIAVATLAGCRTLSPSDQARVAADGIKLTVCASMAHGCKMALRDDAGTSACWDEYEECMVAHGFRDAGAEGGK